VAEPAELCRLQWFNDLYRRIYDVLSIEGMLPGPCNIHILPVGALEAVEKIIVAAAMKGANTVWFKVQPPSPITFAHELIHLVEGKDGELEEAYAYNLSPLVVLLAERNIVPPVNPLRLFNVTPGMVLDAINQAYNHRFKDLIEYFKLKGVIPHFVKEDHTIREGYSERDIVVDVVSELATAAERDERALKALLLLLEWLRGSR